MEKNILVVNIGSSSKKYSFFEKGKLLFDAHFEKNKDTFEVTYGEAETKEISRNVFTDSLSAFLSSLKKEGYLEGRELDLIGLRLVAPGEYFTEDRIIDDAFLEKLSLVADEDKAHIEPIQKELSRIRELFSDITVIAISDSSFHKTIPSVARNYALPKKLIEEYGIYRFGYHGISLSGIVKKLEQRPLGLEKKVIICHLGSGASVTAVLEGKSISTSMGYSPLDGLVMSSRVGDIDVGAILHLVQKKEVKELQEILYTQSGLLAISGLSNDMRVLIDADKEGHKGAHNAIETFAYSIQKHIAICVAALGGVDVIVFSGTIGERSFILRDRICSNLKWLNVCLDDDRNTHAKSGDYIGKYGTLGVCVAHSDEDGEIVRRVGAFC
jgi:acetate kinase